jgi:hypothetical protein
MIGVLLTSTNGQDVNTNKIRYLCVSVCEEIFRTRDNHESMSDSKNANTVADEIETTSSRVGDVPEENRKRISKHGERL